jgi:hypothetical protein
MSKRSKAKGLAKAFKKMSHRKKGGTKGTFTAAATKAGRQKEVCQSSIKRPFCYQ